MLIAHAWLLMMFWSTTDDPVLILAKLRYRLCVMEVAEARCRGNNDTYDIDTTPEYVCKNKSEINSYKNIEEC